MSHPATLIALASLCVSVVVLGLLALMLYLQHQIRREVRASTPAQLTHAVRSVQQQLGVWAALLGEGGAREIRARLDAHQAKLADHERRLSQIEQE